MSKELTGRRALVTGASSGMGAQFARQLAAKGAALVVVARRRERLEALAAEVREASGVSVDVVAMDLAAPGAAAELHRRCGEGEPVTILVNNAGFAVFESFGGGDWADHERMLQLNILTLTELTHRFVADMLARGERSYVLNVASVGAYQPVPYMAAYGASKAYVRDFTEALAYELRGTPVSATSLCPGATKTEFFDVAGSKPSPFVERTMMSAADCAAIGLEAMRKGRPNVVAGAQNKLGMWLTRFVSRKASTAMACKVIGTPD